jgi:hypothetical protein
VSDVMTRNTTLSVSEKKTTSGIHYKFLYLNVQEKLAYQAGCKVFPKRLIYVMIILGIFKIYQLQITFIEDRK